MVSSAPGTGWPPALVQAGDCLLNSSAAKDLELRVDGKPDVSSPGQCWRLKPAWPASLRAQIKGRVYCPSFEDMEVSAGYKGKRHSPFGDQWSTFPGRLWNLHPRRLRAQLGKTSEEHGLNSVLVLLGGEEEIGLGDFLRFTPSWIILQFI